MQNIRLQIAERPVRRQLRKTSMNCSRKRFRAAVGVSLAGRPTLVTKGRLKLFRDHPIRCIFTRKTMQVSLESSWWCI